MTTPARPPAVEIAGLTKSYRSGLFRPRRRTVLRELSLAVASGEVFGYLGPNGSGKTTTLKVLMGLVRPDAGSARILGHPLADSAWRYRVGYLPENPYFYDYLTAREYLEYAGRLCRIPAVERAQRAKRLLALFDLEGSASVPMRRFSKGMLQRIGLAQALMNDPELLFLDEPMSGLDPIGRRLVRDVIVSLREAGKTVFFSTHILSDAEALCDRVALLRAGELVKTGRLDEILTMDVSHLEVTATGIGEAVIEGMRSVVQASRAVGERWRLEVREGQLGEAIRGIEAAGGRILGVQPVRQSLEDYFLQQMGEPAAGAGARWED